MQYSESQWKVKQNFFHHPSVLLDIKSKEMTKKRKKCNKRFRGRDVIHVAVLNPKPWGRPAKFNFTSEGIWDPALSIKRMKSKNCCAP